MNDKIFKLEDLPKHYQEKIIKSISLDIEKSIEKMGLEFDSESIEGHTKESYIKQELKRITDKMFFVFIQGNYYELKKIK